MHLDRYTHQLNNEATMSKPLLAHFECNNKGNSSDHNHKIHCHKQHTMMDNPEVYIQPGNFQGLLAQIDLMMLKTIKTVIQ